MGKDTLRYLLLYVGVAAIVALVSYVGVAWYLRVPIVPDYIVRVLPATIQQIIVPISRSIPTAPLEGEDIESVERLILPSGITLYHLRGKFVKPLRIENKILQGEFIIDGDPSAASIPIIWEPNEAGLFALGTVRGSFDEVPDLKDLVAESAKETIKPTEPVQITIEYLPGQEDVYPDMKYGLERILQGFWSNDHFMLVPTLVTIFRP